MAVITDLPAEIVEKICYLLVDTSISFWSPKHPSYPCRSISRRWNDVFLFAHQKKYKRDMKRLQDYVDSHRKPYGNTCPTPVIYRLMWLMREFDMLHGERRSIKA